jgi:hypothetical protein
MTKRLSQLLTAIWRLEERGMISKSASNSLRHQRKVLEQAIATKNTKLIERTVESISRILYKELER